MINDVESRIDSFKKNMDAFSKKIYYSFIDNISLTVDKFIVNMKINKMNIEIVIGAPLSPLQLNND